MVCLHVKSQLMKYRGLQCRRPLSTMMIRSCPSMQKNKEEAATFSERRTCFTSGCEVYDDDTLQPNSGVLGCFKIHKKLMRHMDTSTAGSDIKYIFAFGAFSKVVVRTFIHKTETELTEAAPDYAYGGVALRSREFAIEMQQSCRIRGRLKGRSVLTIFWDCAHGFDCPNIVKACFLEGSGYVSKLLNAHLTDFAAFVPAADGIILLASS